MANNNNSNNNKIRKFGLLQQISEAYVIQVF